MVILYMQHDDDARLCVMLFRCEMIPIYKKHLRILFFVKFESEGKKSKDCLVFVQSVLSGLKLVFYPILYIV